MKGRIRTDAAQLHVIDAVDDVGHQHNLDAGLVQVVDGLPFHIKEVAYLAVRVGCVADAVKLEKKRRLLYTF